MVLGGEPSLPVALRWNLRSWEFKNHRTVPEGRAFGDHASPLFKKKLKTRKWCGPLGGSLRQQGSCLVPVTGGCLISTDVSSTPPHPLSPQLGTCMLQGGEVLVFPFGSPPSFTHAGDKHLPLAGPLLSFWAEDYEARTGVAGHQPQVGDYGLKFQQEPKGRGSSWAQLRAARGGTVTFPWPGSGTGHWSFLRGLIIQLQYISCHPGGWTKVYGDPWARQSSCWVNYGTGVITVSADADKGRARAWSWEDGRRLFP